MERKDGNKREWLELKKINGVLAYAASMMLTSVPPVVCESVLDGFYGAVRKSLVKMRM